MAPAFSKEGILQGSIDHLCLVCESYLRSERDVCLHVSTPAHRRNLDSTDYVEKYKNDQVRKVKKWYFCEFCNVLVSTVTSVGLHVEEPRHIENRSSQPARVDGVIVIGNVGIHEDAWHGLIDDNTCTICNVEYEDKDVHMKESTHVINLIQHKVTNVNNSAYRKVDDSTFHCLTCNEVVAEIAAHLNETKHKKILQQNIKTTSSKQEEQQKIKIQNIPEQNSKLDAKSEKHNSDDASDILDAIPQFQRYNININFESRTAVCKRCSKDIEFNCKEIENHIEEHKNNVQKATKKENDEKNKIMTSGTSFTRPVFRTSKTDNKKNVETKSTETTVQNSDMNDVQKVSKEHGLTFNHIGNKVYCPRCDKHIPSSVQNIIEHVHGEFHKSRNPPKPKDVTMKKNTKKCNLKKVPFFHYFNIADRVKNILTEDIVVDEKHCIDFLSFLFLTMTTPGRIRCQVCEVNLSFEDIEDHKDIEKHKRAVMEVPVVICSDSEFVREIRSDIFQCGYCNIYDTWEGMENHLKSSEHKEMKAFSKRRLSQHLPKIMEKRMERQIFEHFIMNLLLS